MLLFIIFLFCDLLMVGVFFAVYGGKRPYAEGMLLGVHLPQEAADQAEVVALMDTFRRRTRRFYLVNLILGVAVCLVAFWRFSPLFDPLVLVAGGIRHRCPVAPPGHPPNPSTT